MNQKQLTQFAVEHHIAHREIGYKVVLIYRDAHAEAFFMFDEHEHYARDSGIAHFMAMDARRHRVMSALKLRASELEATLYRNSIANASGVPMANSASSTANNVDLPVYVGGELMLI